MRRSSIRFGPAGADAGRGALGPSRPHRASRPAGDERGSEEPSSEIRRACGSEPSSSDRRSEPVWSRGPRLFVVLRRGLSVQNLTPHRSTVELHAARVRTALGRSDRRRPDSTISPASMTTIRSARGTRQPVEINSVVGSAWPIPASSTALALGRGSSPARSSSGGFFRRRGRSEIARCPPKDERSARRGRGVAPGRARMKCGAKDRRGSGGTTFGVHSRDGLGNVLHSSARDTWISCGTMRGATEGAANLITRSPATAA